MSSNSITLHTDPRSGPQNQAGFVTQGQVDWVGFGSIILSASVGILHRLSGAGVQPTTHCGGLALSTQYRIGEVGRRRIEEALQRLSGIALYENVLYVGFGTQSLVRILEETEPGIKLLGLCTCLTDAHSEVIAAGVLSALWDLLDFPLEYKPSRSQFGRLLKACAGVSSVTTFGSTVDVMLRSFDCKTDSRHKSPSLLRVSAPEDIAKVLEALFRISRGELESINVVAGGEGAFIAAISCWLFDFRTETRNSEGDPVFTNFQPGVTSQVSVQFDSDDAVGVARISSTTYVLHKYDELWDHDLDRRAVSLIVRTPWSHCLERTFGSTFTTCLGLTRQLGTFLGSAARIYTALAQCEPYVSAWPWHPYIDYSPSSYGLGFVDSAMKILPELSVTPDLERIMKKAAEAPYDQAIHDLDISMQDLQQLCRCKCCKLPLDESQSQIPSTDGCCVAMTLTIRQIIVAMSSACVIGDLSPTLSGLEEILLYNMEAWSRTVANSLDLAEIGLGFHDRSRRFDIFSNLDLNSDLGTIFLGTTSRQTSGGLAFSHSGICIFSQALREISSKAEFMRRVFVIPGRIQYNSRCYDEIVDIQGHSSKLKDVRYNVCDSAVEKVIHLDGKIKLDALVVEPFSGENLRFGYRATLPDGGVVHIQPLSLVKTVLSRSGLLYCDHKIHNKEKDKLPMPCSIVESGWSFSPAVLESLPRHQNVSHCLWMLADEVARCVALSTFSGMDCLIRSGHSCLPCSVNAALKYQAGQGMGRFDHAVLHII